MRKKYIWVLALFLMSVSCEKSEKKSGNFDYGSLTENSYGNSFFGLHLDFPKNWKAQAPDAENLSARRKEGSLNDEGGLKAEEVKSAHLFFLSRYASGINLDENPSLMMNAINLDQSSEIDSAQDYLEQTRDFMDQSEMVLDYKKEPYSLKINGADFWSMAIHNQDYDLHQEYFVTVRNGFVLSIIMAYASETQKTELHQILNTLKFD